MNVPPYYSLSKYYQNLFGEKVYKIALNANLTCPNRDGTIDTRGCIFCSKGGSGEFASDYHLSIYEQIEEGKKLLASKNSGVKFVAYFQAFTNTYGDLEYLRKIYFEAAKHKDIVGLSIATRPDCLSEDVLSLIQEVSKLKKVWIELGLQSIHASTEHLIRRGYPLSVFDEAVEKLNTYNIDCVVHLIVGLPYETRADLLASIDYVVSKPIQGVKLQLLHILRDTDLEDYYQIRPFHLPTLKEYANLIVDCIERIPAHIVIHRITGDGPKNLLIEPKWSQHKKNVLNTIQNCFKDRNSFQGKSIT